MKKAISIAGIVASVITLYGILAKVMHWPGGGIAVTLGILGLAFAYVPLLLALSLRTAENTVSRLIYITGALAAIVGLMSVLFRVMHWPLANILMTGSLLWLAFIVVPAYFIRSYRLAENKLLAVAGVLTLFTSIFLLFRVTTQGESREIRNSVFVMHQNLRSEVEQRNEERIELAATVATVSAPRALQELGSITDSLIHYIEGMRVRSIVLTQDVSEPMAMRMNLEAISWGRAANRLQHEVLNASTDFNAHQLRALIEQWKLHAETLGVGEERLQKWLSLEDMVTPEYGHMTWEQAHFRHATVLSLVTYLDQLSLEVNQRYLQLAAAYHPAFTMR